MKLLALLVLAPGLLGQGSGQVQEVPAGERERARIEALLHNPPKATEMVIEYRPIRSLEHTSQWHIGESFWWVRLHDASGFSMSSLDKAKRYRVTGVVLEQNYGMVEVWMHTYSPVGK